MKVLRGAQAWENQGSEDVDHCGNRESKTFVIGISRSFVVQCDVSGTGA